MRCLVGLVGLCAAGTAWAQTVDSGCLEAGATGFYTVRFNGVAQELYVEDVDGDGLPEEAWCLGDEGSPTSLTITGVSGCLAADQNLLFYGTSSCDIDVGIVVGSSAADTIDCSTSARPVLMFGGDGGDVFTGSAYGDFLHGGDGGDVLNANAGRDLACGGPGGDTMDGQAGIDLLWGGPGADYLLDQSLLEGTLDVLYGSLGADELISTDTGVTLMHGGSGPDDLLAACNVASETRMHGGLGSDAFDACGTSVVFGQDVVADTFTGLVDFEECRIDLGNTTVDDPIPTCTTLDGLAACANDTPLVTATHDAAGAWLYLLDTDGAQPAPDGSKRRVSQGAATADRVLALAKDPADCGVTWAVIEDGGAQALVTIDTSAVPLPTLDYAATLQWALPAGTDVADLAFGADSQLYALTTGATVLQVDAATQSSTVVGSVGRPGATGLHMAFDGPETGFFFVTTQDGTRVDVDVLEPTTGATMPAEDHLDADAAGPFTFHAFNVAGGTLEIDDSYDAVLGGYPMWTRGRRSWGGGGRFEAWTAGGACAAQCVADIDDPPDALTLPHWLDVP
ncbi:MAG: hypothetical protein KTR31_38085 [Myxococcales bacterium]|nr:hypothetical protein [Myxococcales bacterium]